MSSYLSLMRRSIIGLIVLASIFFYSLGAEAAESVVLKYSFFRDTVSVSELSTFARTGNLSPKLQAYLKLAGKDPSDLRRVLTQAVKVNPNFLSRVLNSVVGEVLLDQVSQVVHTPDNRANRESLRGALVSAALPDGNITLIKTLENYPTSQVLVEGDRLVEFAQKMQRVVGRLPNIGF